MISLKMFTMFGIIKLTLKATEVVNFFPSLLSIMTFWEVGKFSCEWENNYVKKLELIQSNIFTKFTNMPDLD